MVHACNVVWMPLDFTSDSSCSSSTGGSDVSLTFRSCLAADIIDLLLGVTGWAEAGSGSCSSQSGGSVDSRTFRSCLGIMDLLLGVAVWTGETDSGSCSSQSGGSDSSVTFRSCLGIIRLLRSSAAIWVGGEGTSAGRGGGLSSAGVGRPSSAREGGRPSSAGADWFFFPLLFAFFPRPELRLSEL